MRFAASLLATAIALAATGATGGAAQLLPAGEFAARDGRPGPGKTWRLSDEQGRALAVQLNATAAKTPIVIDYDHRTLYVAQHGGKAEAAGWIKSVEWRDAQGLFAQVEWTPAATKHITEGEYRYISPVILTDPATGAVKGMAMASLVNLPALLGMEPALAALSSFLPGQTASDPTTSQTEPHMDLLVALSALLALGQNATAESVIAAVTALKNQAEKPGVPVALATALGLPTGADEAAALAALTALQKPDASHLVAMQALQTQLAALQSQVNTEKLTGLVDGAIAAKKLLPAQRDWAIGLGQKDMTALSTFLASAPVIDGLSGQTGNKERDAGNGQQLDALATNVMASFGLTAEQFAKGKPATAAV